MNSHKAASGERGPQLLSRASTGIVTSMSAIFGMFRCVRNRPFSFVIIQFLSHLSPAKTLFFDLRKMNTVSWGVHSSLWLKVMWVRHLQHNSPIFKTVARKTRKIYKSRDYTWPQVHVLVQNICTHSWLESYFFISSLDDGPIVFSKIRNIIE